MENLKSNPSIVEGDLLELSPLRLPHPILKPSQKDNLILLQTPVQKNLKVSFLTPKRTPLADHNQQRNILCNRAPIPTLSLDGCAVVCNELVSQSSLPVIKKVSNLPGLKDPKAAVPSRKLASDSNFPQPSRNTSNARVRSDSKWESLRKLDENSRWRDRVEVITKLDHEEHMKFAREAMFEIISKAVDMCESKATVGTNESCTFGVAINPSLSSAGIGTKLQTENAVPLSAESWQPKPRHNTYDASPLLSVHHAKLPVIFPDKTPAQITLQQPTSNDSKCFKTMPSSETNALSHIVQSARSLSDTIDAPPKDADSNAKARHHSVDLHQVAFDFDPLTMHRNGKTSEDCKMVTQLQAESLDQNVFSPVTSAANDTKFALRSVDSIFGDNDFVDSTKLVHQGHLDLDYLEKKTSGAISADLQKESLYVKFDPLLEGLGKRQSVALLGRKSDIIDFNERVPPIPEEVDEDVSNPFKREPDLLCDSPPRVIENDVGSEAPKLKQGSSGSSSSEISSTDGAGTQVRPSDVGIIEVLKYTDADMQRVLQKKRDKWMKEKNALIKRNKEREEKLKQLKIIFRDLKQNCQTEAERLHKEKTDMAEHKVYQKGVEQMVKKATKDITGKMSRLFHKLEVLQNVVADCESNEKKLKERAELMRQEKLSSERRIEDLQTSTAEALRRINTEKSSVEAHSTTQIAQMKIKVRTTELRSESEQTALNHKKTEKESLLKICDELVSSSETHS